MIELKKYKEFPIKNKLSNTKKLFTHNESPSKEPSLITTQFKPKSNTSPNKSNKPSSSTNPFNELSNEFNTYLFKPKLSTTPNVKNMQLAQELDMSNKELLKLDKKDIFLEVVKYIIRTIRQLLTIILDLRLLLPII
jgi:hypothetical protein